MRIRMSELRAVTSTMKLISYMNINKVIKHVLKDLTCVSRVEESRAE
jgi:hypothetical protein